MDEKKIIKQLKNSKKYEYSNPLEIEGGKYQEFIPHRYNGVSLGILNKSNQKEIHFCFNYKDSYEKYVLCKLMGFDFELKTVEKIIEALKGDYKENKVEERR